MDVARFQLKKEMERDTIREILFRRNIMRKRYWGMMMLTAAIGIAAMGVQASAKDVKILDGNGVQAQFDGETGNVSLYGYREDGTRFQMSRPSQISYPVVGGSVVDDFTDFTCQVEEDAEGTAGAGDRMTVTSRSKGTGLARVCELEAVDGVEGLLHVKTSYEAGDEAVEVEKFVDCEFSLFDPEQTVWSYNGGGEGQQSFYDTLQKIDLNDGNAFYRANKQDETSVGVPAADIYSADGGITVGDASATRRSLQTPVAEKNGTVYAAIQRPSRTIGAREKLAAGEVFVEVHGGDYYAGLRGYAEGMRRIGFKTLGKEEIPESSYDLRWESWGWEFDWTLDLILDKLDELEELGIKQVTLDDGWYINAGEWNLTPDKLPNGDADMKKLTDAIHEKGMTALLWWRPCDGGREESALYKEHPEYFVQNQDGSTGKLAGPGAFNAFNGTTGYALCPSSEGAVQSQIDFVKKAMNVWGFDGLKSDYVWSIPKCYNPAHDHERPEESTEQQAVFYREAYKAMRECDPDAFHLLCNCGTPQDYYSFPYVTQIPTADPTSVDQTRRRVKAYKALAGDYFPVTTDHNELWYPSAVGTGAVLIEKRNMTGALQADYEKWLKIAQEVELQKGEFIGNLYSYGFDPYETYVVNKDGVMYYAFYRDGKKYSPQGNPTVELKGLDPCKMYRIVDYVNNQVIATNVRGSQATFDCSFANYLLVRAEELSVPDSVLKEISVEETEFQFGGAWNAEENDMFSGGSSKYTQEPGASVSYTFQGSGIAWYGQKDTNFGTAKIYIDNVLQAEMSCNGAAAAGVKLYEKTGLSDGSHTIRIECVTPVIDIDRFVYVQKETGNTVSSETVSSLASSYQAEGFAKGEGWEAFEAAKSRLESLRQDENADPSDIAAAEEAFFNAILGLRKEVKKESIGAPVLYPDEVDTTEQDFTMLYRVIAYAENLDMQNVIPAAREQYEEVLKQARQVFQDSDSGQNVINRAWAGLLDKIQYAGFTAGDKADLNKTVTDCKTVNLSSYQNTEAFEKALNEAEAVLRDENALAVEVEQALDALSQEYKNLKPKTTKPQTGGGSVLQKVPGQAVDVKAVSQAKSLKVTWKKQADAASYTVSIKEDGKWRIAGTTTDNSFNIAKLKSAKKYQVKVTARNAAGAGKESAVLYAATKPAKPKVKRVKNYKATGIKITCKKNGETGFEVWVKKGKKAYKKAAKGSKTVVLKKGIRASGKVSVKIRGYVKYKVATVYGAFAKVKLKK